MEPAQNPEEESIPQDTLHALYTKVTQRCLSLKTGITTPATPMTSHSFELLPRILALPPPSLSRGVLARWGAGHIFFTIPHPCLFLPPPTQELRGDVDPFELKARVM